MSALQATYSALKPLEPQDRERVLTSVRALFGSAPTEQKAGPAIVQPAASGSSSRPVSLIELIKDKQPKSNMDLITLFAYYRDQVEGRQRFGRNDLRAYFPMAKQNPPGNFDRDFVKAVKRGWLHEDAEDSYITSRGMEAIASGFPGETSPGRRKPSAGARPGVRPKKKPAKRRP